MKPPSISPLNVQKKLAKTKSRAQRRQGGRRAEIRAAKTGSALKRAVPQLELYQAENDPLSHSVRSRLSGLGIDFVAHSVPRGNDLKHKQLIEAGGKDRIPFLVDHRTGVSLYDAHAIVAYLENEYGAPVKGGFIASTANRIDRRFRSTARQWSWKLRGPLDRIQGIGGQIQGAVETLRGSVRYLRDVFATSALGAEMGGTEEVRTERATSSRPHKKVA